MPTHLKSGKRDKGPGKEDLSAIYSVFYNSPDPIFLVDREGTITDANTVFNATHHQIYANCIGADMFKDADSHASVQPFIDKRRATVQQVFLSGRFAAIQDIVDKRCLLTQIHPIRSRDGKVNRCFILTQDITARNELEQQYKDQESHWDITSQSCRLGLWKLDLKTMALDTNAEHDRIYGITPYATKWSLMSFLDKVIPEDRPTIESYIHDNIADAADGQFECRIRRADGSIRWLSIIGKFQFDRNDQATHILGVTQDITRQKKLEIQNRDINTQLNFTLDKCHIGAWSMDLSSKKIHGTQEHSRLFGYPERHPVWDFELFLHHIIPEDRSFVKEFALNVINRPDKWEKEYRIRRTDGEVRWIRDIGDVELDQDGKPVRLLGLLMDITETKQASLESHTLQQQLQHAQKMELLGQLAGGIAHDFNNILAVILGNAQMALRLVHDDSPLLKYLNTIEHSVTRSAEMVRQMLAFARKQQSNPQNILLDYELNNIQLILRKLIEENIELRFQLDSPNQCVNLDPSALLQIISNLVINSRDAISGTGVITIRTALLRSNECDGYVVTAPEFDGYHIRISVSDTGCGIDSQTLPHIFEPFFTTKPVGRGTGLGLSMAYGLVKQNNGLISCHSELGEGTTFNICFPLANTRDKMQEISTRNSPQPNVNGTILLIEDEPSILSIIKSTLEEHGFRVQTAPNAEKGVEVIRSHKEINIVISDIILPGMNGIQMSKEILKLKPDTKFIFMSGYSSGIFGDQGESEIGTNFISKPFSINDLLTLIAKVCPLDPDPGKELPHT